MHTILRSAVVRALFLGVLGAASPVPAHASAPLVQSTDFVSDNELIANCGDFMIIGNGAGSTRLSTYFDAAGNPDRLTFQGRYRGTLSNSVTGYSLVDAPSVANIFIDLVAQTQTNVGAYFTITIPGKGAVLFDAGRIVFDGNGGPTFMAGQHHPPPEQVAILCEALR